MKPRSTYQRMLGMFLLALGVIAASIWVDLYAKMAHVRNVGDLEPVWLTEALKTPEEAAVEASLARVKALVSLRPAELALGARTKEEGCQVDGALPDAACSPGAVFEEATTSVICVPGYTKGVRSVSTALKKKVYAEYGIAYPQPTGTYEADHIIPLELGGSNDIANLFPEAASPVPGFKEKDVVEDYLHEQVCAGNLNLVQAQEQIAQNWLAVYQSLDPSTVAEVRQKYRSWAN